MSSHKAASKTPRTDDIAISVRQRLNEFDRNGTLTADLREAYEVVERRSPAEPAHTPTEQIEVVA